MKAMLLAAALMSLSDAAIAACREDLVATAQNVERTRAQVKASEGQAVAQCPAYRQHIAALSGVKGVFARCDTGGNKGKNAEQVTTTIAALTRQMRASCKN